MTRECTILRRVGHVDGQDDRPADLDVIFVHGLGGDHESTWRRRKQAACWLEWLHEDMANIAVWSLGYPAAATEWISGAKGMALPQRASGLIERMLDNGIGSRGLVFVCHSLGGLVVKQVLRHCSEEREEGWGAIAHSTRGVAFLATPHTGAPLANIAVPAQRFEQLADTTGGHLLPVQQRGKSKHLPHGVGLVNRGRRSGAVEQIGALTFPVTRGARVVTHPRPLRLRLRIRAFRSAITPRIRASHYATFLSSTAPAFAGGAVAMVNPIGTTRSATPGPHKTLRIE